MHQSLTLEALLMRIASPSWWAFADWPVSDGLTDGLSATRVSEQARVLALMFNASKLVTRTVNIMLAFTLGN